jgi:hypothetical protein
MDGVRLIMRFSICNCLLSVSSVGKREAKVSHVPLIVHLFLESLDPLNDEGGSYDGDTMSGIAIARR